jgi:hypothetical protein
MSALTSQALAAPPCDFMGLSVGDKMTSQEIMSHFGIQTYKTNPDLNVMARPDMYEKYGLLGALEELKFEAGPYCEKDFCNIPYGITIGIDEPAKVAISFDSKTNIIQAIDIFSDENYWSDLKLILSKKYGVPWKIEKELMPIINFQTKKTIFVNRETITRASLGKNLKSGQTCEIWATQYDQIYIHPTPPAPMQSVVEIKLVSGNF